MDARLAFDIRRGNAELRGLLTLSLTLGMVRQTRRREWVLRASIFDPLFFALQPRDRALSFCEVKLGLQRLRSLRHPARMLSRNIRITAGALAVAVLGFIGQARAEAVINIVEFNGFVSVSGSGWLNIDALEYQNTFGLFGTVNPADAGATVAPGDADFYAGAFGPISFGEGELSFSDAGSGDAFGISSGMYIVVPVGYVSGGLLDGSSIYLGRSLASMGLVEGTYFYTWGFGESADSLTVNVGAVPEPTTVGLLAVGGCALALRSRKRR